MPRPTPDEMARELRAGAARWQDEAKYARREAKNHAGRTADRWLARADECDLQAQRNLDRAERLEQDARIDRDMAHMIATVAATTPAGGA